jgi:hypothetical protein
VLPEVFECARCDRQFVVDEMPDGLCEAVHCPQCGRYLGERDVAFVLRSEIDELIERLEFERDRLEKDEAIYGSAEHEAAEMQFYGKEIVGAIRVLREAVLKLRRMRDSYRPVRDGVRGI